VDLTREKLLVTSDVLSTCLRRLQSLIVSHPNPGLTRRLLNPLLLPLWAIATWTKPSSQYEEEYALPARNLLKIYLRITSPTDKVMVIIHKLLYNGAQLGDKPWIFQRTSSGRLQIVSSRGPEESLTLEALEPKANALIDLLESISTDEDISALFLTLMGKWLVHRGAALSHLVIVKEEEEIKDPYEAIMEGAVLQSVMQRFPDKLASRTDNIIELVEQVLGGFGGSGIDSEGIEVSLSLLNLVITAPGFRRSAIKSSTLDSLETSLGRLSRDSDDTTASTARNLSQFLKYRDEVEESTDAIPMVADRHAEDRKTYNLALSYITGADSPPPVRSEGLNLIQKLIDASSPILDIPAILILLSSLLEENEDYINLRVIKMYGQLADKHPKSTTRELIDRYVDANETASIDARLRFGEALLQVVERLGETFSGDTANQVGEALLATAGRRGKRTKTEARQARDARLQEMKRNKAQANDEPESEEDVGTDSEKADNAIMRQITEGWGSKRGSEDIRIRASALSIFSAGIETNIGGLGATLVSAAVDLSIHVLTLEAEPEQGILRRAAIVLILSFARALDQARQSGRRLGFGLTDDSREDIQRIMKYLSGVDNDGLVRQHARDLVESLESLQMTSMLARQGLAKEEEPGLAKLKGLAINPVTTIASPSGSERPRIEEIE